MTKLSGRCEETGRRIIGGVGGGNEQKARWIDWQRLPEDWDPNGPDLEEIVLLTRYDPLRKPMIAKTAYGNKVRWQLATEGMKVCMCVRVCI